MSDKKHNRQTRSPSGKQQTARTTKNIHARRKRHEALLAEHKTKKEAKQDER